LLVAGIVGLRYAVAALGTLDAEARPATVQEAPDPAHVAGTYVGNPHGQGSALPAFKRMMVWLLVLTVLAALGVGLVGWGVQMGLRNRAGRADQEAWMVDGAEDR